MNCGLTVVFWGCGPWFCLPLQVSAAPAEQQGDECYALLAGLLAGAGMGWADVVKRRTFRTPTWEPGETDEMDETARTAVLPPQ